MRMRRKLTWLVLLSVAIVVTALYVGNVLGTPPSGFVGTTLAVGRFGEIALSQQLDSMRGAKLGRMFVSY